MSQVRKVQKVGHSTLMVSIPAAYAKELEIKNGDNMEVREELDGSLRLVPALKNMSKIKAAIKADAVGSRDMLSRMIIGCYMLGYDTIEVLGKGLAQSYVDVTTKTIRRLRGMEIVESSSGRILAQNLMDPTKFPVDSLIRRLQLLASRSIEAAMKALRGVDGKLLNEAKAIQDELDELYWLLVRQLLLALSNREISAKIELDSPLHASGDRVSAKAIQEIGRIMLELIEEMMRQQESGAKIDGRATAKIETLGRKAQESFNFTIEGLISTDIRLVERGLAAAAETQELEKKTMEQLTGEEYDYARTIIESLGQVARYCTTIAEIALNRKLRSTSKICTVQTE